MVVCVKIADKLLSYINIKINRVLKWKTNMK